jgi:signal transduction histidine kinase
VQAPIPLNDAARVAYLRQLRLDMTLPFDQIQGLCEVASRVAGAPIALVSLVDETEQRFLASVGVGDIKETPREIAFCAHAIMDSTPFEVIDASLDERFADNPLVTGGPKVQSYYGVVLEPAPEMRIGTLCLLDTKPRCYNEEVRTELAQIGQAITALLIGYRKNLEMMDYAQEIAKRNTELAALTLSLQRATDQAVAGEKAKGEFLAVVSHELRTPLTSIRGALGLIKSGVLKEQVDKTRQLADIAYQNSERLLALVGDILLLQEMGRTDTPEFDTVDLAALIASSAEAYKCYGADQNITFEVTGLDHPVYVRGNRAMLDRVLANVLSNAVKFSHHGGKVVVDLTQTDDGPRITVTDRGVGIPDGAESKVFGLFSQVDSSDQRSKSGSGLGMHICQKILAQHGARVTYDSTLGQGTSFVVQFTSDAQVAPKGVAAR